MTRRQVDIAVATGYAVVCFLAVLAPALAVRWSVFKSDIEGVGGRDIVAASVIIGAAHAAVAWVRLRSEERTALRRSHMWIASLNALAVLSLSSSVLLLVVLLSFPDTHAAMANRGFPVVVLWAATQLVAVILAEATGRVMFWWLEPHGAEARACKWRVLPAIPRPRLVNREAAAPVDGSVPIPEVPVVPVPPTATERARRGPLVPLESRSR
ncbi:MAG TPA: hypothetical protein VKA65_03845 [Acidimicrobiales bacterium]|nr:hypothetical protein [Acidimicrobiales bacterium]